MFISVLSVGLCCLSGFLCLCCFLFNPLAQAKIINLLHIDEISQSTQQNTLLKKVWGGFLMAQWLRIHLPMQETQVQSLIWEEPPCCGATESMHHNYQACALELGICSYCSLLTLEPMLHNKRSYLSENPLIQTRVAPACHNNRKPARSNEDPVLPKINKWIEKKKKRTKGHSWKQYEALLWLRRVGGIY